MGYAILIHVLSLIRSSLFLNNCWLSKSIHRGLAYEVMTCRWICGFILLCVGVYALGCILSDEWLSETFATKGFFASFLLTDIFSASILISLFSFPSFFQRSLWLFWLVWIFWFLWIINYPQSFLFIVQLLLRDILGFEPSTLIAGYASIIYKI